MSTDDEPDVDDVVTTGVLDAERRGRDQVRRRRQLLVGGALVGLLLVGAVLAVLTANQQRANREAELAADRAEARTVFAEAVVERAEDYEPPATVIRRDAPELRGVLEQFLTETEITDEELGRRVAVLLAGLEQQATIVADLRARDVPEPAPLIDPDRAVLVLRELETLRVEATALAEEVPLATSDVETWLGVVRDVNMAVAEHVAQVESEEPTSDPQELVELWRDERPALLRLSAAATAADDVPGLEEWAAAHQDYASALLEWIDTAVTLLEAGDLATYNERFEQQFGTDDPFGFDAAVAAATGPALASPALLQLDTLEQRAQLVLDRIVSTEVVTAEQLGNDGPAA